MSRLFIIFQAIGYLLIIILVIACDKAPPPVNLVEVIVEPVQSTTFQPTLSFVGRLQAEHDVEIQAQVTGYLQYWDYHEGDIIEKGHILYQIDSLQFEADLMQAKAALAGAKAAAKVATRNEMRGRELVDKGAISAAEMDRLEATKLEADAALEAAHAEVKSAEVNLAFTTIKAPIHGRIGRSHVSPGDLVSPATGALTTLVSIDPMQVVFQASEAAFLRASQHIQALKVQGKPIPTMQVQLILANDEVYPSYGVVDYMGNRVDEYTGTVEVRATIPNAEGLLRPGQYAEVVLALPIAVDTLMLPQIALQTDQQGDYVFVVGPDDKVLRRNVIVGEHSGDNMVVNEGIEEGERVIIKGLQKVRPGQQVKVVSSTSVLAQ